VACMREETQRIILAARLAEDTLKAELKDKVCRTIPLHVTSRHDPLGHARMPACFSVS
jgi:hypothetical protein